MADYQKYCLLKLGMSVLGCALVGIMIAIGQPTPAFMIGMSMMGIADSVLSRKRFNELSEKRGKSQKNLFRIIVVCALLSIPVGIVFTILEAIREKSDWMSVGRVFFMLQTIIVGWWICEIFCKNGLLLKQYYQERNLDEREKEIHQESTTKGLIGFFVIFMVVAVLLAQQRINLYCVPAEYLYAFPSVGFLLISLLQSISGLILFRRGLPSE